MKFSEQWLRQWVNPKQLSTAALCDQLSLAGLEVDGFEPVAAEFSQILVGEIIETTQHPDADRLKVCQVNVGEPLPLQIVCGGANARTGIKVCVAVVGAVIGQDFKIKKAKLRGVESQGMLCSEQELGLAEKSDGIMELPADAPLGQAVREYLQCDDHMIEIELTANRGDCFSIKGVAREVAALNDLEVSWPEIAPVAASIDDTIAVTVSAEAACPKYACRVVRGIDPTAATPLWMQEQLRRSGIRSISPVVDVTNYVMIALGQPMHGFDLHQLSGGIEVRYAKAEERLTLLDGQEVTCDDTTLLITDQNGPLALAGIMGGEHSGVDDGTTDIVLESAFFAPLAIMGKPRQYGLHTDSSVRFERGVDPEGTELALEYATQLLLEIAGGQPGPVQVAIAQEDMPDPAMITLTAKKMQSYLGIDIPMTRAAEILTQLGMHVSEQSDVSLSVEVPTYRFDMSMEADVIEEVARIHGYHHIPAILPDAQLQPLPKSEHQLTTEQVKALLVNRGFAEAITYSFIDPKVHQAFFTDKPAKVLQNPIANDMSSMRTSLLPGICQAVAHNISHQQNDLMLFEMGRCFVEDHEPVMLTAAITGSRYRGQWNQDQSVDFYALKAELEAVLAMAGKQVQYLTDDVPGYCHPGRSAWVKSGDVCLGVIGQLHPALAKILGIKVPVYIFELLWDVISECVVPQAQPISKYPTVQRDLALVVPESLPAQALLDTIRDSVGEALQQLYVFDVYQGAGLPEGKKSLALKIGLQSTEKTLTDEEANHTMSAILEVVTTQHQAQLREA